MTTMTIELRPLGGPSPAGWPPARTSSRPTREMYLRRRAVAAVGLLTLLSVAGLTVRSWPGSPGGNPASASGRAPAVRSLAGTSPPGATPSSGLDDRLDARTYVVQPGDSLWSIAQALVGDGDVARVVHTLTQLNGDDALVAGQQLVLPG